MAYPFTSQTPPREGAEGESTEDGVTIRAKRSTVIDSVTPSTHNGQCSINTSIDNSVDTHGQRKNNSSFDLYDLEAINAAIRKASPRVFRRWRAKGYTFDEADPATWPLRFVRENGRPYTPKPYHLTVYARRCRAYRDFALCRSQLRMAIRKAHEMGICFDAELILADVAREAAMFASEVESWKAAAASPGAEP